MKELSLGVIGMSPGNGHPYSWSAIFNGFDPKAMASCPFPVIPQYLAEQDWPSAAIPHAKVTHIWTQDAEISQHIAAATCIPHICGQMTDLIDQVDAVLLARDDPENHLSMALPFLQAGIPVYIDKPVATDLGTLEQLFAARQADWHLFSCSAVGYAPEFHPDHLEGLGEIRYIEASIMKDWEKYGIHIIDPVLRLIKAEDQVAEVRNYKFGEVNRVAVTFSSGKEALFVVSGDTFAPLNIRLYGSKAFKELVFKDTFRAFKTALEAFVEGIREEKAMNSDSFLRKAVTIIEQGKHHG